ncbi:MAG: hypothetical protein O2931_09050 [Planctomycetota bacterium]|nr:hypothetical protein [Planctomycetota bacterium]MDA1178930.1 hypothetical protein [Planctomycetota bacterium]
MMRGFLRYLANFSQVFAAAWHRFWFQASDPSPLAVLRIFTGLAAIDYFVSWAPDLQYWWGQDGILRPEDVRNLLRFTDEAGQFYGISYLNLLESPWLLNGAHAVAIVVAVCFTLGICTRVASVLLWLELLSYVHRAPMLTTHLDPVLTAVVGYLCLAPCGTRWSWDAWRRNRVPVQSDEPVQFDSTVTTRWTVSSNFAQRLIQVHLTVFYLLFALSKLGGDTWWNGEAMWWLTAQSDSPLLDASGLGRDPIWINVWTHAIVGIELLYPVLIWNRWTRPLIMMAAIVSWTSLALVTGRITFCLLMIGLQVAFFDGLSPYPLDESHGEDSSDG